MPVCARPKLCSNLRIVETRDGALQYRRSDCAAASSRASRGVIAIGNAGKQASGRADERTTKALCAVLSCLARARCQSGAQRDDGWLQEQEASSILHTPCLLVPLFFAGQFASLRIDRTRLPARLSVEFFLQERSVRTHALHVSVELMQSTSTEPRGNWHLSLPGVKKGTHDKRAAHSTHTHTRQPSRSQVACVAKHQDPPIKCSTLISRFLRGHSVR